MILAGDIGGTNTRLAVFDDALRCVSEKSFTNAGRADLVNVLDEFRPPEGITAACFGVAGPVKGGTARLTNLEWTIDAAALADRLGLPAARVEVVNDLAAHGVSTTVLDEGELEPIQAGTAAPQGDRAIVMPGTGLGVGGLTFDKVSGHHRPVASEGGHADFAPRDGRQERLLRSMRRLRPGVVDVTVSWEDCLSGPGLRKIYACLAAPDAPDLPAAPTPKIVTQTAADGSDPTAIEAVDLFVQLLGQAAAGFALAFLATGGVYLGGNIAAVLAGELAKGPFLEAFTNTGPPPMRALLEQVPVLRMRAADTGLRGAAQIARWAARER